MARKSSHPPAPLRCVTAGMSLQGNTVEFVTSLSSRIQSRISVYKWVNMILGNRFLLYQETLVPLSCLNWISHILSYYEIVHVFFEVQLKILYIRKV